MITMLNEKNGKKTAFKNYQSLLSYLDSYQRMKIHNNPNHLIDDWFFACHSRHRITALCEFWRMQRKPLRFDFFEVSYDKSKHPIILPMTPDLDIEKLRKGWCKKYCEFHGFKLVDIEGDNGILHVKGTEHPPVDYD